MKYDKNIWLSVIVTTWRKITLLFSSKAQTEPSMDIDRLVGCRTDEAGDEKVRESAILARMRRCSSLSVKFTEKYVYFMWNRIFGYLSKS